MASMNRPKPAAPPIFTGGGGQAIRISALANMRRNVLTCLLWEDTFYDTGKGRAKGLWDLIKECHPDDIASLAIEAREQMHLRHVPLFLAAGLCLMRTTHPDHVDPLLVESTIARIIQRPDELSEFLAIYWGGKTNEKKRPFPLSRAAKRGLQRAFGKFNEYSLAKYAGNKKGLSLLDVMRIVHPKPVDQAQSALWKRLRDGELASPETWENRLSRGENKKAVFEDMLEEGQLGGLAFLRNLRNMEEAKVDRRAILKRFEGNFDRVLPFRFIAAAKHAPSFEAQIEQAMFKAVAALPRLAGTTVLIVDVSGSMGAGLSGKSDMNRLEVAASLAMITRELAEDPILIATAGSDRTGIHRTMLMPARRGMGMHDTINTAYKGMGGGGIFLVQALNAGREIVGRDVDRVIVLTDEQDCDRQLKPGKAKPFGRFNYLINISNEKNGVGYGEQWTAHIDGWSERVFDFITACEADQPALTGAGKN